MFIFVIILSIFVFIKTIGYAIYEYNANSNTPSAIIITILAILSLIAPIIVTMR